MRRTDQVPRPRSFCLFSHAMASGLVPESKQSYHTFISPVTCTQKANWTGSSPILPDPPKTQNEPLPHILL